MATTNAANPTQTAFQLDIALISSPLVDRMALPHVRKCFQLLSTINAEEFRTVCVFAMEFLLQDFQSTKQSDKIKSKIIQTENLNAIFLGLYYFIKSVLRFPLHKKEKNFLVNELKSFGIDNAFSTEFNELYLKYKERLEKVVVLGNQNASQAGYLDPLLHIHQNSIGNQADSTDHANLENFPTLADFQWRVDVAISSTSLSRIFQPSVLLGFLLQSTDGKTQHHTIECSIERFRKLKLEVAKALKLTEDICAHPMLTRDLD